MEDAEFACIRVLEELDKLSPEPKLKEIIERLGKIQKDIILSKSKIMMKSRKGVELSKNVKNSSMKFEREFEDISGIESAKDRSDSLGSLLNSLEEFESEVSKMTTSWRSFEANIT